MAPRLPVALASRETLKPPQHEWTGMLAALQDQPAIPQPLAEKAFMRGALAAWESPEQGRALRVIGAGVESGAGTRQTASIHFPRSGNLDDFVLSSVFRIDADEEGSFTNDAFHLRIGTGDAPDLAPAAAAPVGERLDEKTLRLLQTLKAEPQIEALSDAALADVTDPTVIEDIRKLIAPIEPLDLASRSRDEALSFRIDPDESGGDLLEVRIEIDAQASIRPRAVEVLVLRSEDGADRREPGVWVMINLELPVWNRWLVSLRQERNAPDEEAAAHDFALQFGQSSQAVRDASPYQPVVVEPIAAEDHALAEALDLSARLDAERGIDIVALMAAVLEETGLVQGGGAAEAPLIPQLPPAPGPGWTST